MSEGDYGIIPEGPYDPGVYEELVRRIVGQRTRTKSLPANGISNLLKRLEGLLQILERVRDGRPVEKALVIRDSDVGDPETLEGEMAAIVGGQTFRFPRGVQYCAVERAVETWLLVDVEAITHVALARGVAARGTLTPLEGRVDQIRNPKKRLAQLLWKVGLEQTEEVYRQIAKRINLDVLRTQCASFGRFEQKVKDC